MPDSIDRRHLLAGTAAVSMGAVGIGAVGDSAAHVSAATPPSRTRLEPCITSGDFAFMDFERRGHRIAFAKVVRHSGIGRIEPADVEKGGFHQKHLKAWCRRQTILNPRIYGYSGYNAQGNSVLDRVFAVSDCAGPDFDYVIGPTGVRRCQGWRMPERINNVLDSFYSICCTIQRPGRTKRWLIEQVPHDRRVTLVPIFRYLRRGKYTKNPMRILSVIPAGESRHRECLEVSS